jgi:hypothetical protein
MTYGERKKIIKDRIKELSYNPHPSEAYLNALKVAALYEQISIIETHPQDKDVSVLFDSLWRIR